MWRMIVEMVTQWSGGGMTGSIRCIVLALFPIVLHFVASCPAIRLSCERREPVKVIPACNQPRSLRWIEEHHTCYAQTNRSISFTMLKHKHNWAIVCIRSGMTMPMFRELVVTSDVLRVIVATAPWSHTWYCPRPPQPRPTMPPVTQFKRNNFTTKH